MDEAEPFIMWVFHLGMWEGASSGSGALETAVDMRAFFHRAVTSSMPKIAYPTDTVFLRWSWKYFFPLSIYNALYLIEPHFPKTFFIRVICEVGLGKE